MAIYEFEGKSPLIHPQAWVAPSADIIGRVTIGPLCYIGWGAILRGDHGEIEIGRGSAVEEGVIIHARAGGKTVVGEEVTLGHGAMLHNAVVEDFAVIGMRAVISNNSRIGRWAIVGEMGLVQANREIEAESLAVGHPVRIIGPVQERHKERWIAGKNRYLEFARRNRTGLREVSRQDLPD